MAAGSDERAGSDEVDADDDAEDDAGATVEGVGTACRPDGGGCEPSMASDVPGATPCTAPPAAAAGMTASSAVSSRFMRSIWALAISISAA